MEHMNMVMRRIGLCILSLCAIGSFQENENGTFYLVLDTNNKSMNWSEAHNYCQSLNSSLIDPFEHEVFVNGTFWTNRYLTKYSSWIYIEGCVNISSLNGSGRIVSSLWQCDNLCNHTKFFGIQNSTCVCLDSIEYGIKETCDDDCLKYESPFDQCGRKSDSMTLYGKFTEYIQWNSRDGNCLAIESNSGTTFQPYPCNYRTFHCVCSRGVPKNVKLAVNWTDCFYICDAKKQKFTWTTTYCCNLPKNSPVWIAVTRQINVNEKGDDSEPFHCYKCEFNTSECMFDSCSKKYLPQCRKHGNNGERKTTYTLLPQQPISTGHDNVKSPYRENSSKGKALVMTRLTLSATTDIKDTSERGTQNNKNDIEPDNKRAQIIIAATLSCVAIIVISTAMLFIYRYRRMKAINNDDSLRVLFQNEYSEMNKPCNTTGNRERFDVSSKAEDDELPYVDSHRDVYDRLGEKRSRKFTEESDGVYNRPGPADTQYGDVCLAPSDDMYDHTMANKMNDSDYDSCARWN